MSHPFIYMDNCATTKLATEAFTSMLPFMESNYGNASSTAHKAGRIAAEAVFTAREQVAALIHAHPKEITFTSGATESNNMAIKSIYEHYSSLGNHIITCKTEHPAVLEVCRYLESKGARVTYLDVDAYGHIDLSILEESISRETILIALMAANNETGVTHPVQEIGAIAQKKNVLFFCDATQAVGILDIDPNRDGIDILSLSAHKFYGPKGIGAIYIKRKPRQPIQIHSIIHGGKQENGLRGGTLNVPAIVGMGTAAELAHRQKKGDLIRLSALRDQLEQSILQLEATELNGKTPYRLPHVSNICFRHIRGSEIMTQLPNIALSSGSACATGSLEPSHVLLSMGLSTDDVHSSLRFSLGRYTTEKEIHQTIDQVKNAVDQIREKSPIWQLFKAGLLN
ncbi:cysteine desulfurase family protein [Olivibacter sitiensis]|uniref:cysteine desulfurase family protein n=1 Tax=Olivibacter sitiensis TaxID=376470 RepID=UPI00048876A7|nr:cysteine desulfurase family protein [Olivibacter sitiensis]